MADNRLMTHLVAGYPSMEESKKVALAMVNGGAVYLEVQFPFSDPIADGPLIQGACTEAIANGFTTDQGFSFIRSLTREVSTPVFLMTYANLVLAAGIETFVKRAVDSGASGLIIPDLPYDYDEGLYDAGKKYSIPIVPVVIPGISSVRLDYIKSMKPEYIYTAIRKGITGAKSTIDAATVSFLNSLSKSGAKILAGFGIREREQVVLLSPHVHSSVIGSALVEVIRSSKESEEDSSENIRQFVLNLSGSS
jgi:tryptophan synthase alpha chain